MHMSDFKITAEHLRKEEAWRQATQKPVTN